MAPRAPAFLPAALLASLLVLDAAAASAGEIFVWGGGASGSAGGADFVSVAAGFGHGLALDSNGALVSWGVDTAGVVSGTPAGSGYLAIAANEHNSAALDANGAIVAWGSDADGIVSGVPGGTGHTAIALGVTFGLALDASGNVVAWGDDAAGQVSGAPAGPGHTAIAAGLSHGLALAADGSIEAWGFDNEGQVSGAPGGTGFTALGAGVVHSLALTTNGQIVGWGLDDLGQVSGAPPGGGYLSLAAGGFHSIAIASDGAIVTWGSDTAQQISGTPGGVGFTAVDSSGEASVALGPAQPDFTEQTAVAGTRSVEYSNLLDEAAADGHLGLDPGQILHGEARPPDVLGNGLPRDALDIAPGIESGNEPDVQIDALASGRDAFLDALLANQARLLFSTAADGFGPEVAAYGEATDGSVSPEISQQDLDANEATDGSRIDDVDALEVWGLPAADDATYYSIPGDAGPGVSVFRWDAGSGSGVSFVSHATVVAAVTSLGYAGAAVDVDLDALMVRDAATPGVFESGDAILFSIREVPGSGFDGGEVVLLESGSAPVFLSHGGHAWDAAFDVAGAIGQPQSNQEVDAIEALPGVALPFDAEITFEYLPAAPPGTIVGTGVATAVPGAGVALRTLALHPSVSGSDTMPITDPLVTGLGLSGVELSATLGSGTLARFDAPPLSRGRLPLRGELRLCVLSLPCSVVPAPLTSGSAGLGVGGILTVMGGLGGSMSFTFQHAPWTLGTASVSYTADGESTVTAARQGFVHGPLSATSTVSAPSGVIQLVTPTRVSASGPFGFDQHAHLTTLRIHFTPEPGLGLLLGSGALGLLLLARRRRRD